jgi:replication fork protection complex subunit Tof1/Swi1
MFKDNKLRLLMTLVGFTRLGAELDPEASWIIPSSLASADLQEAIDLIRKFEFDPPVYDDGKTAEDFLRSKAAAARRSTRRVEYDDDSDGIDHESEADRGEYAVDGPTARKSDGRKVLKRRRRERTPVELDDEERELRAEARRKKELEKQRKVKSTMFVHDSDDEDWDEERDKEFFEREKALRESTVAQFKKSLALGSTELASTKKRKGDEEPTESKKKKRKSPPKKPARPFDMDDSGDEDEAVVVSSRESSPAIDDKVDTDSEKETTDTPLSSQHAGATHDSDSDDEPMRSSATAKIQEVVMADAEDEEDDVAPITRRPAARSVRAGFVIDSDSE